MPLTIFNVSQGIETIYDDVEADISTYLVTWKDAPALGQG